ncbi:MAG: hypothetical protein KBA31_21145 [Alphaproteobacteria bacterium]|nr:hypothetical protein [Alphaproteobacteria bacterium]
MLTATTSEPLNRYTNPAPLGTQTYAAANPLNQYPSVTPIGGSAVALAYDANGNLTGDGVSTFTYDAVNRLVAEDHGVSPSGRERDDHSSVRSHPTFCPLLIRANLFCYTHRRPAIQGSR